VDIDAEIASLKGEGGFDDAKLASETAAGLAADHKTNNAAYLSEETDAQARVDALEAAAGGSDETAAKQAILTPLTAATVLGEAAVKTQLARVEALIAAKRTQDQEEALWDERVAAANTAVQTATTAKATATAAVDAAKAQVTTRAWLFETLGQINVAEYAAACNTGGNPKCALAEDARTSSTDKSVSTWSWPANCNIPPDGSPGSVETPCMILGLSGSSTGLIQSATAAKGTARVTSGTLANPTELFAAYETADYTYTSSATQLSGADSNKQAIALAGYLAW
jgi:hypothetical protein